MLGAESVELLPMEQWDTGIIASADEKKALKEEARAASKAGLRTVGTGPQSGEKKKKSSPARKKTPAKVGLFWRWQQISFGETINSSSARTSQSPGGVGAWGVWKMLGPRAAALVWQGGVRAEGENATSPVCVACR